MSKRPIYPSRLMVDVLNHETGKMESVWMSTGPYRPEVCGRTEGEIKVYLAHIVERFKQKHSKVH